MDLFPSENIYHNNLAQAIEILHAIDASLEIIDSFTTINEEKPVRIIPKQSLGIGVIEAPRGTLYHKYDIDSAGIVKKAEIIVPTGQNQICIEKSLGDYAQKNLDLPKEELSHQMEKLVRAYDPCMSCASHFLKLKIEQI